MPPKSEKLPPAPAAPAVALLAPPPPPPPPLDVAPSLLLLDSPCAPRHSIENNVNVETQETSIKCANQNDGTAHDNFAEMQIARRHIQQTRRVARVNGLQKRLFSIVKRETNKRKQAVHLELVNVDSAVFAKIDNVHRNVVLLELLRNFHLSRKKNKVMRTTTTRARVHPPAPSCRRRLDCQQMPQRAAFGSYFGDS